MKQKFTLMIVLMLITVLVPAQEVVVPVNNKQGKKTCNSHANVPYHEWAKYRENSFKVIDQYLLFSAMGHPESFSR